MAHTSRGRGARTDRCNCCCCGLLHGGGLGLGLSWAYSSRTNGDGSTAQEDTPRRPTNTRRSVMGKVATKIKDWLVGVAAGPPTSAAAPTSQAVDAASNAVASAIVNVLKRNGYSWSRSDHVLCDFLAAAACAMQEFRDQFQRHVAHIVSTVLSAQ